MKKFRRWMNAFILCSKTRLYKATLKLHFSIFLRNVCGQPIVIFFSQVELKSFLSSCIPEFILHSKLNDWCIGNWLWSSTYTWYKIVRPETNMARFDYILFTDKYRRVNQIWLSFISNHMQNVKMVFWWANKGWEFKGSVWNEAWLYVQKLMIN